MHELRRVEVEGFKSIRTVTVELGRVNVLVGANGSGKTNFLDVFDLVSELINRRLGPAVGKAGGAERVLFNGAKTTQRIRFDLSFEPFRYVCVLGPAAGGSLYFEEEACWVYMLNPAEDGAEWLEIPLGRGQSESNLPEMGKEEQALPGWVLGTMAGWRRFHFHDTSPSAGVRQSGPINDNRALERDGKNLAAFLYRLRDSHPTEYGRIANAIRLVAPFFADFVLAPNSANESFIRLEWRASDSDSYADATSLSDGTLRFMCLATLLLQPEPPALILIDEPELGLHPFAMVLLADLMKATPASTQLIVSTQSTTLLNQFDATDIVVVDRLEGASTFTRLHPESLREWLDEYAVGELWEKNVLGGRPGGV